MGHQVACQSAESQEQVETILSENDALRTNLAALEQVPDSSVGAKHSVGVVLETQGLETRHHGAHIFN